MILYIFLFLSLAVFQSLILNSPFSILLSLSFSQSLLSKLQNFVCMVNRLRVYFHTLKLRLKGFEGKTNLRGYLLLPFIDIKGKDCFYAMLFLSNHKVKIKKNCIFSHEEVARTSTHS